MGLAIVTGASRGIGRALALRLAQQGHQVACLARSREDLESLAREHEGLEAVPVDLVDAQATQAAVDGLFEAHGHCEILVNNAGYGLRSTIEDLPMDAWRREFEVNLFSATALIQQVLPGMRAAGGGTVVNISSVAGRISPPFSGGYAATKFAMEAMSDALRVEVAHWGIRVILVEPGPVATDFAAVAREESEEVLGRVDSPYAPAYEAYLSQVGKMHATQGWTTAQVVDRTVAAIHASRPPHRVACYGWLLWAALRLHHYTPRLFDRIVAKNTGMDVLQ